ncbi:MAG TPA: putative Ig domain-containing protein, partial [Blastocatellia bacterium]|nr:putative Ig domain-containing protein [Blastocatellia bacterium]
MLRKLPLSLSSWKKHRVKIFTFALCLLALSAGLLARHTGVLAAFQRGLTPASSENIWQETTAKQTNLKIGQGKTFKLDRTAMGRLLARAPREFTMPVSDSTVIVSLPLADGRMARFRVVESNILAPELAKQFPEIKSYSGQGADDPTLTTRFGWSQRGLSAMILGKDFKATVLPPDATDVNTYFSSFGGDEADFNCGVQALAKAPAPSVVKTSLGNNLRVYRMAIATSAQYLSNPQLGGGSTANAVASLNGWLNAANAIFEREMAVRLTLVNNTSIIGLNNIINTSESAALGQIAPILGQMVGSANYDIGHVFISQGGGGIAGLGVVCDSSDQAAPRKGSGSTSFSAPVGNAGTTGVFVHEVGHMFGAPHTFNGTVGQFCSKSRSGDSGFETGSGTTNMSYGGLCSQGNSTDNISGGEKSRFHNRSFTAMSNYIATTSCAVLQPTGNQAPNVSGGGDFTIPKNTPFALTAVGSDPDAADVANLTYNWEQIDAGGAPCPGPNCFAQDGTAASYSDAGDPATTTRPILRPYPSSASPTRIFPNLTYILNNGNVPPTSMTDEFGRQTFTAENLPSIGRKLNFAVTVRDNRTMGGVSDDTVQLTVDGNSGPFAVTAPNTAVTWTAGSNENVTWDVNNTNAAPVNAANVKISLSTDGGQTFPIVLLANTANDGNAQVTVPTGLNTSRARVKVEAVGNVFFDISNANFTINGGAGCPAIAALLPAAGAIGGTVTINGTGLTGVTDVKFSNNVTATFNVVNDTTLTATVPAGAVSGPLTLTKAGCGTTLTTSFTICTTAMTGSVDDGMPDSFGGGPAYFVNRITPASYPATLSQVEVFFSNFFGPQIGSPFQIIVATNPGGGTNINGASFQTIAATVQAHGQFNTYGVTPLTIASGDFLVGFVMASTQNVLPGAEDVTTPQSRSYSSSDGTNFTLKTDGNFLVRAGYVTGCAAANCVTVTNAAPTSGAPGTPVTITGTGFIGVSAVRFGGNVPAQFTVNSDTSLTAVVPAGAATGAITLSRPGCADAQTAGFTVSAGACPTITGISPMTAAPGSTITITGTGLLGVSVIKFGGNAGAAFTVVSDTTITATVPAGAQPGQLTLSKTGCPNVTPTMKFEPCGTPLTLQVDDGSAESASSGRDYTVNRLTPIGYPATLNSVSFRFDSFQQVPVNSPLTIVAGGNPGGSATFTNITFTTVNTTISALGSFITVTLPNPVTINSGDFIIGYRLMTGNFKVLMDLTSPQGRSYSSSNGTTFTAINNGNAMVRGGYALSCAAPQVACPTITGIAPTNAAAGATVTITGTDLTGVNGVKFSNNVDAANFTVVNATTITAVVPASAVSGPITITKPSCGDAQSASFTVNQPVACQTVTGISPTASAINTIVTINGTNLSGVTDVIFTNGQTAQFMVASNTMITATVPAGAMTGPITLKKASCTDVQTAGFTVQPLCPTVAGYSPQNGAIGQEVTITGTNFTTATTVAFAANAAATVIFDSSTQIRAIVPATAVTGPIKVGQPGCPDATAGTFTITTPCPTADSLNPTGASVGDVVTITGTNLTGVTAVKFNNGVNGATATFTVVNDVTITATVPAGALNGAITLEKTGCATTNSPQFTVIAPPNCPTVADISPKLASVGATVTLTGTNFTGATQVLFKGPARQFISAASFNVVDNTTITAVVPFSASFGPVLVRKTGCTDVGSANFTPCGSTIILDIDDASSEATQGGATHYINRITPLAYPTTISAVGIQFNADPNLTAGMNFTLLAAANPSGLANIGTPTFQTQTRQITSLGGFDVYTLDTPITITSGDFLVGFTGLPGAAAFPLDTGVPQGRSYLSQNGTTFFSLAGNPGPNLLIDARVNVSCTPVTCPTVTNFAPGLGGVGTGIIINGTGFTGITAVKFANNVDAANFTVMSDTELSAFVPSGAVTGPITLIKPNCPNTQTGIFNICAGINITPPTLSSATVGTAYNVQLTATPTLTVMPQWTLGPGGPLPPGLTLNQTTGSLSGTPTQAGTFMFSVKYGEPFNTCSATQNYTLTVEAAVNCPTITLVTPGLLPGKVGALYTGSLTAMGGVPPHTFSLMSGTLPTGLTLATDGSLTGTPTAPGTFGGLVIKATDANNCSGTATYSVVINPGTCPDIKVGEFFQPASGAVGTAYTTTIPVDPPGTYTFAVASGTLPAGLTLNTATGEISGTPNTAGGAFVIITATNGASCVAGNSFAIEICAATTITPPTLTGVVGVPYNGTFTSVPAVTDPLFGGWNVVDPTAGGTGPLPPGLTLSQAGVLSGTPTMAGSFPVTVNVLVGGQCSKQMNLTITINPGTCPTINVNPTTLTAGQENVAYNAAITATPAAAYTFTVLNGALPAGLSLSTGGTLSGTPTATGTFTFTVEAKDANNCTGQRQYALTINRVCPTIQVDAPVNSTLPAGSMGQAYAQQTFTQTGTTATVNWSVSAGTLPGGLALAPSTGLLSGTPTATGNFAFTVRATDANGCTGERQFSIQIGTTTVCPTVAGITPTTGPVGSVVSITGTGFTGVTEVKFTSNLTATFQVVSDTQINATVPAGAVTGPLTISKAGCNNLTTTDFTVVTCPTITVSPTNPTLTAGTTGTAYVNANLPFTQTGGAGAINWTVSAGTLPNGLSLNAGTGALSGTPTAAGAFTFTIRATDANNCTGERQYMLTINSANNGLQFFPLPQPVRLLETRAGFGGCTTPGAIINAGGTFTLPARTTCAGIPADAQAVTGNITVVPTGGGFLTLFPSSAQQPTVANSNFGPGEVTNNVFTVGLGAADGAFKIFASGTTHVIVDVTGYYAPPAAGGLYFHPLATPVRLLETRAGLNGCIAPGAQLIGTGDPNADPNLDFAVQGRSPVAAPCNSIPASAQVLVGNATSVVPSNGGFLTIYPSGGTRPLIASSNYAGNDVINGPFAVKLGADGKFKIYTLRTTHLVIDILGYYSEEAVDANGTGLLFNPLPVPVRLLETRPGGLPLTGCTRTNAPIQGNLNAATHTQQARNFCGLPASAQAVVGNVSVVSTPGAGFLTLFPGNLTNAP